MNIFLNVIIFVTIFVPFSWAIYVPEHTRNNFHTNGAYYVQEKHVNNKNKLLGRDLPHLNNNEDVNQYIIADGQQNLLKSQQAQLYTLIPRQKKSYDIDDDVVVGVKNRTNEHLVLLHKNLEAQPTSLSEHKQQQKQKPDVHDNDVLLETKKEYDEESYNTPTHLRQKRQLSDLLIAPNTRWCGRGNTANGTYNHLGGASIADRCCRTHDHCKLFIPAMSKRFDLFNYRLYTLSHCKCDHRFRTCLKMANDEDANTIGKLFFNLVQTQCFVLVKEKVCLLAKDGTCLKEQIKQKAYLRDNKKF